MPVLSRNFNPRIGPLIQVIVAPPGQVRPLAGHTVQEARKALNVYELLVDTGADTTCISKEVVDSLELSPQGTIPMTTPDGLSYPSTYLADIAIPFGEMVFTLESQQVIEFKGDTKNYKGLIGRDILCRGVLNISFNGIFTFAL